MSHLRRIKYFSFSILDPVRIMQATTHFETAASGQEVWSTPINCSILTKAVPLSPRLVERQ